MLFPQQRIPPPDASSSRLYGKVWAGVIFLWALFLVGCTPDTLPQVLDAMERVATPPAGVELPATVLAPDPSSPLPAATVPVSATISADTPPALFTTSLLYRGVRPRSYIPDACVYLQRRWAPDGSPPGAIVAAVMYHGMGNKQKKNNNYTPASYFKKTVAAAKRLGFETVTTQQLADFLEYNAPIPPRSLILIVDDRYPGVVERYFLPVAERNNWTVTLGWIVAYTDRRPNLWERVEALNATGRVDVQSHGLRHLYIVRGVPVKKIREELFGPIPILTEHFGARPLAFIWPGGNFTSKAVKIAREAGYRLAFTAYQRGPLMFNWIPQGKPERKIGDPLMLLPRYWSYPGLIEQLEIAVKIGEEAKADALKQYPQDAAYYAAHCGGVLPPPQP